MNEQTDVFGREVLDAFKGLDSPEIIERSDRYITSGLPIKRYLSGYPDWPQVHKQAIKYARGRVLDVGCGAGRHSLYLQGKGHPVLGLDISPGAIEVCQRRGLKNTIIFPISQISKKFGQFDTILLLTNNFGLVESPIKAKNILKQFYALTSARGRIIAESSDPYNTVNPDNLEYQKTNREKGRMSGQIKLRLRYKRMISLWFDYLLVSKVEMQEILLGTGWQVQKFLETDSRSYVAIIEKARRK